MLLSYSVYSCGTFRQTACTYFQQIKWPSGNKLYQYNSTQTIPDGAFWNFLTVTLSLFLLPSLTLLVFSTILLIAQEEGRGDMKKDKICLWLLEFQHIIKLLLMSSQSYNSFHQPIHSAALQLLVLFTSAGFSIQIPSPAY